MIVITPEKSDVVTHKGTGDVGLSQLARLLIMDQVHLLHEDRGAVIESLVAHTLQQVSPFVCVFVTCLPTCVCVCVCMHTVYIRKCVCVCAH